MGERTIVGRYAKRGFGFDNENSIRISREREKEDLGKTDRESRSYANITKEKVNRKR